MSQRYPWMLLAAFLLLGTLYLYAIPTFETPDELLHAGMIHHIATEGELPVQVVGEATYFGQEGSQPPLYYLAAALITLPFDWSDYPELRQFNPHGNIGQPELPGNKNHILHASVYPPDLTGASLALRVARMFSLLLGATTVYAVYAGARVLTPDRLGVALLAAGITAFNPQFLFISASANNDNMVTAMNSLIAWRILVMMRDGFDRKQSVLIAVLLALSSLSKLSGLVMMPVSACAALWTAYRHKDGRGLLELGAWVVGMWAVLAGWWYARNIILYDELFGTQTMLDIFGRRSLGTGTEWLRAMLGEFQGLLLSYWGVFGWFSVLTDIWFYRLMNVLMILGVIGFVWHLWVARGRSDYGVRLFVLTLMLTLGAGSLISWTSQTAATQGRLLFPYIAAISTLLALGLRQLRIPALVVVVPLALIACSIPFTTLMPVYRPPPRLAELPESAVPVDVRFEAMHLIGYDAPDERFLPGDVLPLTLYWQADAPPQADYTVSVEVALPDSTVIGGEDTFPGAGSLRTSQWMDGAIYADRYELQLDADATGGGILRVNINVWDFPDGEFLPITTTDDAPLAEAVLPTGAFGTLSDDPPADAIPTTAVTFGDTFRIVAYQLDGDQLTVWWDVLNTPVANYTVIAAVIDGTDIIAQGDAPPAVPTRFYHAGETFQTRHTLRSIDGARVDGLPLVVGWYDPSTLTRLPLGDSAETLFTLIDLSR